MIESAPLGTVLRYERSRPNGVTDTVTGFVYKQRDFVSATHGPAVMTLEPCGMNSLVFLRDAVAAEELELCPCATAIAAEVGPMERWEISGLISRYAIRMIEHHGDHLPLPLWTSMRDLAILHGYALNLPADHLAAVVKDRPRGEESEWYALRTKVDYSLILRG